MSPTWGVHRCVPEDPSLDPEVKLCPPNFHRLVTNLDSTLQGTYQVTVQAQDQPSVGPAQEAKVTLNVSASLGPCASAGPVRASPPSSPTLSPSSSLWIRATA